MKICSTCQEEFDNKFVFCPVDGTPLHTLTREGLETRSDEPLRGLEPSNYNRPNRLETNEPLELDPVRKLLRIGCLPDLERLHAKNNREVIRAQLKAEDQRAEIALGRRSAANLTGMFWLSMILCFGAVGGRPDELDPKLIGTIIWTLVFVSAMYVLIIKVFTRRFTGVTGI